MAGMLWAMGCEVYEARLKAGASQGDVAAVAGISVAAISRFEAGLRWPVKLEDVIQAYSEVTGVRAIELWERGVRRFREDSSRL